MKNNETGEFELVVGDRHLLIAFFLVVLLCGVAFAMGYVVGQNVPRSGKSTAESIPPSSPAGSNEPRPQPLPPAPAPAKAPASESGEKPAETTPQPTTQPAQGSQPAASSPKASESPSAAAPYSAPGLVAPEDLPTGSFWQVMAVAQPQAEALRTTLKDHNFTVILSPGPKGLTRVLVGPYADTQSLGKAKTDLENAGFRPVRYKP